VNQKSAPLVYLAGPITGLNYAGATDWREYAKSALEPHIVGLSPMRGKHYLAQLQNISGTGEEYAHFGSLSLPRGVMTRDRFDATRCDVLFVNVLGAKSVSIGTVMEIAWADLKHIPVVCAIEKSGNVHEHMMINEAIGFRAETIDEALHYIKAILQ
jgi:nucleoside 2-deoxyribosyltransferase